MGTVDARPSFESIYLRLAIELAKRSTCARLQVGCVVASEDFRQVLAVGFNGGASGLENGCDSDVVGACGCVHAEANAITNCNAWRGIFKVVFCTDMPCKMCAKMLINLGGVRRVYYGRAYRLVEGAELLERARITTMQWAS